MGQPGSGLKYRTRSGAPENDKARGRKCREIVVGWLTGHKLRHEMSRNGSQKNAIAIVSRCQEQTRGGGGAEDGKIIRRAGTQARPGIVYGRVLELRQHPDGSLLKAANGVWIRAFVKTRLLESGSDDEATIASWHQVNLRAADHVTQQLAGLVYDAEHLAFHRANGERRKLPSPSAGTIHYGPRRIGRLISFDSGNAALRHEQFGNSRSRRDIDTAVLRRLQRRRHQRLRIHAAFVQKECRTIFSNQFRLKLMDWLRKRELGRMFGKFFLGREEQRALAAQINIHARFVLQFLNELWVHAGAGRSNPLQLSWRFQHAVGEHSRGSRRGFATRF